MTDVTLVRRTLQGDSDAFALLFDRHSPACLRYATRMLGSREDAEEVTQEALLRAHRALRRYDETMPFRTWLMAILINRCRTSLLQRNRRERRIVLDGAAVRRAAVEADAEASATRDSIARAVAQLDDDQREAFLLKHVELLTYEEMAQATGVGVSALKMRVKRACEQLRQLLESDHG